MAMFLARLSRRSVLRNTAALTISSLFTLNAGATDSGPPQTSVWTFNSTVPGPEIRVRQGDRLRVTVENQLTEDTTVHHHGIRLPNAMDGVPHLTQKPIAPGETFVYEFDVPDA